MGQPHKQNYYEKIDFRKLCRVLNKTQLKLFSEMRIQWLLVFSLSAVRTAHSFEALRGYDAVQSSDACLRTAADALASTADREAYYKALRAG
jgi:hypothetical protein